MFFARMQHTSLVKGLIPLLIAFIFSSGLFGQESLLAPDEAVGYEIGTRFTLHHSVSAYLRHIEKAIPNSKLIRYGETYEGRPLELMVLSSKENLENLAEIREQHIDRMNGGTGNAEYDDVSIIWLSYNVHGNEAACTEAALEVLHSLAQSILAEDAFLEKVVILLDPCLNPDGHDRYAVWFNQNASRFPNADLNGQEHDEPWPGGRPNHYLFDLNRDWAWQKQQESQMRSLIYRRWMPHVHCDYHEMGFESPYYFAPAAEPYHTSITDWQRKFQGQIGKATSKAFDSRDELYYTKESFDLLYPSYGDTYPMFNGAIGMTYEQGGSGEAGVVVEKTNGSALTLKNRIANHLESSLQAVYTSARFSETLVDEWGAYYNLNRTKPQGRFAGYLIPLTKENETRIDRLADFLSRNGIICQQVIRDQKPVKGWEYGSLSNRSVRPEEGDLVISSFQTHSRFLDVLFDPNPVLTDSLTYDITTWSLPYAYGLNTYGLSNPILGKPYEAQLKASVDKEAYGFAFSRSGDNDSPLMAQLLQKGFSLRTNAKPFEIDGTLFEQGSLIVLRSDHKSNPTWWKELSKMAAQLEVQLHPISGGFADQGPDMGSDEIWSISNVRVGALTGAGVSSLRAGEVWWHFEQELEYPITMLSAESIEPNNWISFDVIVMPSGAYRQADSEWFEQLETWIREGGRLIVLSNAMQLFQGRAGWGLKQYADVEEKDLAAFRASEEKAFDRARAFDQKQRSRAMGTGDGSIYPVSLDHSHPLAWGYSEDPFYTLRTGSNRYALLNNGWNVGTFDTPTQAVSGFVGSRANRDLAGSLAFGVQPMGNGSVTYFSDNPLFRGFWENGKLMFDNAVFLNID
jgi:hypothetical protein